MCNIINDGRAIHHTRTKNHNWEVIMKRPFPCLFDCKDVTCLKRDHAMLGCLFFILSAPLTAFFYMYKYTK